MKLSSGQRIGQSGQELLTAAAFALFLHVLFALAAVLLFVTTPRVFVPPLYAVKLVSPAAAPTVLSQAKPQPQPAPKPEVKPQTRQKAPKTRPADTKSSLPELKAGKQKPAKSEEEPVEQPHMASAAAAQPAVSPVVNQDGVALPTTSQDFKYGWYLARVRDKIGQHWNPPADAKDARARLIFSVNRSGWVGVVNLVDDQSAGRFEFKQAAIRAIRSSNPFPPLPEDFSKQTLEFTVDLMAVD